MLHWSLLALYAVFVMSVAGVILFENRQPTKTIAWLLAIILLPVVGLIFFMVFGQRLRHTHITDRRRYVQLMRRMQARELSQNDERLPEKYLPLIRLCEESFHFRLDIGFSPRLLPSGTAFLQALLHAIATARHSIHLESYIIEDDAVGRLVRDALADKAREGVVVRVLYDDVGCWRVSDRFFRSFAAAGIAIEAFLPVHFPSLTHKVNFRNHRKICIIDGQLGFVGGMNLALRYVSEREGVWRDLQLQISGPIVAELQRAFLADWNFVTQQHLDAHLLFPDFAPQEGTLMQIVHSNPATSYPEMLYTMTWVIGHARRYLYLQTPYFMPNEDVLHALKASALSGVDVRLMVPRKPDGFWLRWANDSYFYELLHAGIRIFTYTPGVLHTKSVVADDDFCSIGSANIDFRSFDYNYESNAFLYDRSVALQVKALFHDDLLHCREVKLAEWKRRPWIRRLMESFTRILAPLF